MDVASALDWRQNLIEDEEGILAVARDARRVAVLGIKTAEQEFQPGYYVPQYLKHHGVEVVPVPVYYPDVTEILGQRVYRRLVDIPGPVDMVNVFRRPGDIDAHVEDILAKAPRAVWFQLGIRNERAAERLARAGIRVVQDRCLMLDHRRALAGG